MSIPSLSAVTPQPAVQTQPSQGSAAGAAKSPHHHHHHGNEAPQASPATQTASTSLLNKLV
jgi:hypothetical protein